MAMHSFEESVRKHFDFLKNEYSFIEMKNNIGYEKDGLEIEFYHEKANWIFCFSLENIMKYLNHIFQDSFIFLMLFVN